MSHEKIGSGKEHNVYESKNPALVLKTPTFANQLMMWFFNVPPLIIHQEHLNTAIELRDSQVYIPQWRTFDLPQFQKKWGPFTFNNGYVTVQKKVIEDHSLSHQEITTILVDEKRFDLLERFRKNPSNFITYQRRLHLIDPTKGLSLISFLDRKGVLSKTRYKKIKNHIKRSLIAWVKC